MKLSSNMFGRINKRRTGGGGGGGDSDCAVVRILIPSNVAGPIIGKGGYNITRLRTEYSSVIQVPYSSGPERMVLICSSDPSTAVNIVEEIIPCLGEFCSSGKGEIGLHLLIHQSLVGCVIGKGGSKVKELRQKTSAKIKIFGSCCPYSTDRVISIVGQPEVAVNGLRIITMTLTNKRLKGYIVPYDPQNFDADYAMEYGGFWDPGQRRGSVWVRPWGGGGGNVRYQPFSPLYPYRKFPRDAHQGSSQQVTIPKDLAGVIIGKGGSGILRVKSDSGTDITIDEQLPGSTECTVTIKGTYEQIQLTRYLLQQSFRDI